MMGVSERVRINSVLCAAAVVLVLVIGAGAIRADDGSVFQMLGRDYTTAAAQEILQTAGIKGGVVVHVGCGDGRLTAALQANDRYLVHGLDVNALNVAAARATIAAEGKYGTVTVDQFNGTELPLIDNLVNLLVVENIGSVPSAEIMRVLAPLGVAVTLHAGQWQIAMTKPWPAEMDEWTHYFHSADGNPVADDTLVGPPKRLQWIGSPRWSRHHDHMASVTSLVSAKGRLFYIMDEGKRASIQLLSDWKLIARDAFNGTILWKRSFANWNTRHYPLKSGPAHLTRRLVAVGDRVYVSLGIDAPAKVLDAATGETLFSFGGSQYTREILVSDGTAFCLTDTSPSPLPGFRRVGTYVWSNSKEAGKEPWGWTRQVRGIRAYDAQSGAALWNVAYPVAPCSLAVDAARVVFYNGDRLVCLNRSNGSLLWESIETSASTYIKSNTGPRLLLYGDVVLFAGNNGKMSGWSALTGEQLWENTQWPSGHQSLKDLFVVDGLAWTGDIAANDDSGTFTGYDPVTGAVGREFPMDINLDWFHHRCYPSKAAGNYILTSRNGTEFVDVVAEHWKANHWVRGGCLYGVMPCNGMLYASMDACGCQLEAKIPGFKALAPGPVPTPDPGDLTGPARLETGPAYGAASGPAAGAADWPTYRHDIGRSGSTVGIVTNELKQTWTQNPGGRLSAPVIADGKLFVSSISTHTVHAFNAASGSPLWAYTVGGRVDSPPTYYQGLVLFGSADGYVYALRASDGVLAWRFRAAAMDRRLVAWEQLESVWPVHGSVLIKNGVLYCTAGRNIFLDGGIRFIRLDPATGNLIGEEVMNEIDPVSGLEMHEAYVVSVPGNNMPVALSDVLACEGTNIWMRSQKFTLDGERLEIGIENVKTQPDDGAHIFCQIGMLDDSYFFRSYWSYGRRVSGGYGAWMTAGRYIPSGRILCFDDQNVYGFGRKPQYMVNASVLEYEFFSADKYTTTANINACAKSNAVINAASSNKNANASDWHLRSQFPREALSATRCDWTVDQPATITRAMTATSNTVFFAGTPGLLNEQWAYYNPDDPAVLAKLEQQARALEGAQGGELWAISKAGGTLESRFALDSVPVFDGMAAANGCLYIAMVDGTIQCLSEEGSDLTDISHLPISTAWNP